MPESIASIPRARIRNLEAARQRFGHRIDVFLEALLRADPAADDAVERSSEAIAMATLMEQASRRPLGWSPEALERGGELVHRTGLLSVVALASSALVQSYASPAGNKPLVLSGRLEKQAYRRLHETARFLLAVCAPNSMRSPDGPGFLICLRVRLMHARVRQMILRSGQWRAELWGAPANQHDLLGTLMAFTVLLLEGLEGLGVHVPEPEAELHYQLFRQAGFVLGIEEGLLPNSLDEARDVVAMYRMTEAPPDTDSRALAQALFDAPLREASSAGARALGFAMRHLLVAGARTLLPAPLVEAFDVPPAPLSHALRWARPALGLLGEAGRLPLLRPGLVGAGRAFWDWLVEQEMRGQAYGFPLPERLDGRPVA